MTFSVGIALPPGRSKTFPEFLSFDFFHVNIDIWVFRGASGPKCSARVQNVFSSKLVPQALI